MDNYVYIVASLPDLAVNFGSSQFSYADVQAQIVDLLSETDKQMVGLFELGFNEDSLDAEFYEKAAQCDNRFIREYFNFDVRLRNLKAGYIASRLQQNASKYVVNMEDAEFEEEKRIGEIFAMSDFLQREQQLDLLKWSKADEIATMDYFNMNVILAFLAKAHIVQRWAQLDRQAGENMFRQLLGEVRGTFKGVANV